MKHPLVSRRKALLMAGVLFAGLHDAALSVTAAEPGECEIELHPIWEEGDQLLQAIKDDPFAEGLQTFSHDLETLKEELQGWIDRAQTFRDEQCLPSVRDRDNFEQAVVEHNGRCPETAWDPTIVAGCQQSVDRLTDWKRQVDEERDAVKAASDALNVDGKSLFEREVKAVERAKSMLDPANMEEAFWLFAQRKQRDETSCEALAQLYGALGRRVGWDLGQVVQYTGLVLANTNNPFVSGAKRAPVPFGDDGFRPQYVDLPGGNQVRHFVAYFTTGVKVPGGITRTFITGCREDNCTGYACSFLLGDNCEPGDYQLGIVAAELGDRISDDSNLLRGIEGGIRSTVCQ